MTKLLLSIRSLDIGGAERQFIELVKHIDKTKFDVTVCTMYGGFQEEALKQLAEIKYYNLNKSGRYDFYTFYQTYSKLLKEINPDVIYSFLGEMNLFSLWCKPKKAKLIWGFRASNMDLKQYGHVPQILFWIQKKLSPLVDRIIANSYASIEFHKSMGYAMGKSTVIPNGVDTDKFMRNSTRRESFRKMYHLHENDIAIGIVARIDVMKGYIVLSHVAKKLLDKYSRIFFFAVGSGNENIQKECEKNLEDYNKTRFIWLGNQQDTQNIYSGLDIFTSSSLFGEGFSNSIAEAMSCELPCVVTDVGDSAMIVSDVGIVVQPNDVKSLLEGLEKMLKSNSQEFGKKSRDRIIENFSIKKMVETTEKEIHELAK